MTRLLAAGCAVLLAGCASPVVTRIDSAASGALPAQASFALVSAPGELAMVHQQATDRVAEVLAQRGWTRSEAGEYLLAVTLSDRPAAARLQAGDDVGKPAAMIAPAADRRTARGCAKRDHRLSVRLTHRTTGDDVYSGSGAEFHCKARLDDSLPHLVAAALDGLNGASGLRTVERKGVR